MLFVQSKGNLFNKDLKFFFCIKKRGMYGLGYYPLDPERYGYWSNISNTYFSNFRLELTF